MKKDASHEADAAKVRGSGKTRKNKSEQSPVESDESSFGVFFKRLKTALIVVLVLGAIVTAGLAYAGYKVTSSTVNFPKLTIGDIEVGGLTREQTIEALNAGGWKEKTETQFELTLPRNVGTKLDYVTSGVLLDTESMAQAAAEYGHSGSWFSNLRQYMSCLLEAHDVTKQSEALNDAYIYSKIDSAVKEFDKRMKAPEYTVDEEKQEMHILKGAGQIKLDREDIFEKVVSAMESGESTLEYSLSGDGIKAPDFETIRDELLREPKNAYFDNEIKDIVASENGFDFDAAEALKLWEKAELCTELVIPVEVIEPEVTTSHLKSVIFADSLGQMTTSFAGSSAARINNLRLACEKINGIILNPGEVFSYNETLGQRTAAAGFQPAGAYADGEVVEEVGGGICQISSTLYAATLYSRLQTVSRTCHYFAVAYMPKGMDATVSWQKPDFKFANNKDYPIKIVVWFDEYDTKSVTIEILGTATDDYKVEIWHEEFVHKDKFTYDDVTYNDVPVAIASMTYRSVYDGDGNLLYTEPVNVSASGNVYYDYYYYHKEDVLAKLGIDPSKPTGAAASNTTGETSNASNSEIVSGMITIG